MITCRNVQQLQNSFLDGDLAPSLTAEVHAHLLQCPECQHQIETLRACGDVIARDAGEPTLDGGFAQRVLSQLPKSVERSTLVYPRHGRRERLMGLLTRGGLPALAAMVFLAIWLMPPIDDKNEPQSRVAGAAAAVDAAGVTSVLDPTLSAVADTQRSARSLNQMIELGVGQARQGVTSHLPRPGEKKGQPETEFSILDLLIQPINEMMEPKRPEPQSEDIVRF